MPPFVRGTVISQIDNCYISISCSKIFGWSYRPLPKNGRSFWRKQFWAYIPDATAWSQFYMSLCELQLIYWILSLLKVTKMRKVPGYNTQWNYHTKDFLFRQFQWPLRNWEGVTYCEINISLRFRRPEIKPSFKFDLKNCLTSRDLHFFLCKRWMILGYSVHSPYDPMIVFSKECISDRYPNSDAQRYSSQHCL